MTSHVLPPRKRVVSTPRLIHSLHTMSPAEPRPTFYKNCERKKMALREPLQFHMYQKRRYGAKSSCMALWYAKSDREEREFWVHIQGIPRILCLSHRDRESPVRPWLEPVQVLNYPARPTLLATRKLRTARNKPRAVLTQAAKAADEALAGS